ncbi:MAG: TonB-dependent receptor [Gemmatimonadota bacterium]|nr:MAG: TonB-dependent receptor [Gemmatimonadota bacterium]
MRSLLFFSLLLFAAASYVFSQEMQSQNQDSLQASEEVKVEFEPIVVTATRSERPILRVPYAIDVIGEEEIQRAETGLSLDEAVRAVPGIVVNSRHNRDRGDRIIIRGIGSRAQYGVRGIKVILDGIPLTLPDGQSLLHNLDLGSVGKIEILRGPSSSLYGNAAGGLIDIQTQSAPSTPYLFQPRFVVGSDGLLKWQGKLSGTVGRHDYLINANKLTLDGYREHSSASSYSVNAVGRHRISDQVRMTTVLNYIYAPYLLNPGSVSKTDAINVPSKTSFFNKQRAYGRSNERQGQGGISMIYDDGHANQFAVSIYASSYSYIVAIPIEIIDLDWISGGMRTVFSKRFQIGNTNLLWTIGTDIEAYDGRRVEFENQGIPSDQVGVAEGSEIYDLLKYGQRLSDQDERVFGVGSFTQCEISLHPQWDLILGGRYDYYKFKASDHFMEDGVNHSGTRNMDRFSPRVGIIYQPYELVKVYGNYSTAFQTPTTTELGNQVTGVGGFNPDLKPESMRSFEIGIQGMQPFGQKKFPGRRFEYDLSFYMLNIEDMLIPFQIQGTSEEFYRNAGKTQNKGAEIQLNWSPINGLRTSLAYTFMDFVFKDYTIETSVDDTTVQLFQLKGKEVPGVPPQQIFAGIAYRLPVGAYSEIKLNWVDRYFANDYNGPPPDNTKSSTNFFNDTYFVVDLRLGIQQTFTKIGIEIFSGINNLFDERYNSSVVPNAFGDLFFEPAPGRSWYSGIHISFSGG